MSVKNSLLHLGARVTGDNGVTYTRISRLGHSDWITPEGKQFWKLPVEQYTVDYNPKKHDYEAAFNVTPSFKRGGFGFGIVTRKDLMEGDAVYDLGFIISLCDEVARKESVNKKDDFLVTATVGRTFWTSPVMYIRRGIPDNELKNYKRWDD
ncbi:hypothetical protein [Curtobacterium sp. MCBD17_040]|uniref:hypothetical protein n=1 Tax=Curtobacterium sp. MCBD17_040 TaxID=2175674 RepID=UPI000DAA9360|nr:hypothetical protein [Curtobacterium sp. MCBD17_040]WIB65538.1 hypothetical protein DEI94_19380 [Curtobacterium sp. MCBD17_040]